MAQRRFVSEPVVITTTESTATRSRRARRRDLAHDLKLAALVIPTMSGTTARIMAAHRATAR